MAWTPAALNQPPVAYPTYPFPNANPAAKKAGTHASARDRYLASHSPAFSYVSQPWGNWAGTGSYFPGHGAEDARNAQTNMQLAMQQSPGAMAQSRMSGGAGGAGGAAGGTGNALYDSFQAARDAANQANEARYQDALRGATELGTRSMGYLDSMGAQQAADTDQAYKRQASALQQGMINRGLSQSTVADTMQMGNERERMAEQRRLQEDLNRQRLSTDMATTQGILGLMQSKEDAGPSYEMLAQLAAQMGQAGYGAGMTPEFVSPQDMGFQIPMGGVGYQNPYFASSGGGTPRDARLAASRATAMARRPKPGEAKTYGKTDAEWDAIAARDMALLGGPATLGGFPVGMTADPLAGYRAHVERLRGGPVAASGIGSGLAGVF